MTGFLADCRHALRLHARTSAASLIAIAVLAVGVAFVVAFLSLYVDLVLRPHPGIEQSGRIATIARRSETFTFGLPYRAIERMADEMTSIEAAAMLTQTSTLIGASLEPSLTALVSKGFFDGIRPRLVLGRGFLSGEHVQDAEPVVVLSHGYWQQHFGGDPGVLGTSIEIKRNPTAPYFNARGEFFGASQGPEIDSAQYRIVGVLASSMAGLPRADTAVWLPIEQALPLFYADAGALPIQSGLSLVRRRAGSSAAAVLNEFNSRYSGDNRLINLGAGSSIDVIDGIVSSFAVQRDAQRQLELFLVGSLLLAVVAAANVSLFLLARAPGRRRELGIRLAVGAPLNRIARQLATESSLFVLVAAGLGIVASLWLATAMRGLPLLRAAAWRNVTLLDWRVLVITAAVVLVLAVLVSLAPVLGIKRIGIAASSGHAAARASLAQRLAGTVQIAVAGMIGGAAIAFGLHVGSMIFGHPGFELANRQAIQQAGIMDNRRAMAEPHVELARRREIIAAIPGVTRVGFGDPVPGDERHLALRRVTNDAGEEVRYYMGTVTREFVDVLGLKLVHGQVAAGGEAGVVVNQALAHAYWGRDDVVGERLPIYQGGVEVVGVLEDVSFYHPSERVDPFVFETGNAGFLEAVVETTLSVAELQVAVNELVAQGAIEVPLPTLQVRSLQVARDEWIAADRARAALSIVSALLVLALAAFGLYGMQRYLVAAGRREYAIRAALGAGPRALGRLVTRRGVLLGLPGLLLGGLLAFIAVAWLRDEFLSRDISPGMVALSMTAALVALLLAASVSPARETRRIQPAPLLRDD